MALLYCTTPGGTRKLVVVQGQLFDVDAAGDWSVECRNGEAHVLRCLGTVDITGSQANNANPPPVIDLLSSCLCPAINGAFEVQTQNGCSSVYTETFERAIDDCPFTGALDPNDPPHLYRGDLEIRVELKIAAGEYWWSVRARLINTFIDSGNGYQQTASPGVLAETDDAASTRVPLVRDPCGGYQVTQPTSGPSDNLGCSDGPGGITITFTPIV